MHAIHDHQGNKTVPTPTIQPTLSPSQSFLAIAATIPQITLANEEPTEKTFAALSSSVDSPRNFHMHYECRNMNHCMVSWKCNPTPLWQMGATQREDECPLLYTFQYVYRLPRTTNYLNLVLYSKANSAYFYHR